MAAKQLHDLVTLIGDSNAVGEEILPRLGTAAARDVLRDHAHVHSLAAGPYTISFVSA